MWNWTRRSVALGTFMLVIGSIAISSQEPSLAAIMQRKLDQAHALLEGLVMEDFELLEGSSEALLALSEEASWFVMQSSEYAERSAEFRRAVAQIASSARERSAEGAALGYVDMTLKCVQCHRYLRGTQRAVLGGGTHDRCP